MPNPVFQAPELGADDEVPEQDTEETEPQHKFEDYPADHPLVKRLEVLKAENKDLKPKAKRFTELEEAAKSDAEKAADRIAKAEAEAATVPAKVADALKTHLVDLHGIDTEDAELFLTATEPELMLKQVARLLGQSDKRRRNRVPREGENPTAAEDPVREFTRQLFGADQ